MTVQFLDLASTHADLRSELDRAMGEVVDSGQFVGGDVVAAFEDEFASFCGVDHAIGVGNGTEAIAIVLRALGIGPGDEVIVPANTFVATAEAVAAAGAEVVFVDVDPDTLLLTADIAAAAVTPRTAAVIAVHLYGQPADPDGLAELCERAGLALIEDAAQAHGASYDGRHPGTFGVAATFSFYPGKNLGALGDGGAVVTSDRQLAERVRGIANHGRDYPGPGPHPYGVNSRLDSLQAAALRVKLPHLLEANAARRRARSWYEELLADLEDVRMTAIRDDVLSSHHLEVVRVDRRDEVRRQLDERGIQTGVHYDVACHEHPAFVTPGLRLPVVEHAARHVVSLPMHPYLTEADVHRVATALTAVVRQELVA